MIDKELLFDCSEYELQEASNLIQKELERRKNAKDKKDLWDKIISDMKSYEEKYSPIKFEVFSKEEVEKFNLDYIDVFFDWYTPSTIGHFFIKD